MTPLGWVIVIVLTTGIIFLQIFLSRKENKWLGLILPLITLCAAIFFTVVTPFYVVGSEQTGIVEYTETGSGKVIETVITHVPPQTAPDTGSRIFTGVCLFAMYNIPTAVLLVIYAACRIKRKRDTELKKMNIQDL